MTTTTAPTTNEAADVPPDEVLAAAQRDRASATRSGRLIGALLLVGFLTYGIGFALVSSVVDSPHILADVSASRTTLALGALLMLANTAVDIGKAVLFFPLVEKHSRRTALAYLSGMIFQVCMMAVGAVAILSLVPLSEQSRTGQIAGDAAQALSSVAVEANTLAYQVGQAGLAFGAFFLCVLLYRTGMVLRLLAGWGIVGYTLHFTGAVVELLGVDTHLVLTIPGGLFELTLAVWLLVNGLRPADPPRHATQRHLGAPNR